MPMRVAGKPAGDSGQVRLAQAGGLPGRVAVARPSGDSRRGGLRAPETRAGNAGAGPGHPGWPEGPGHPGWPEGPGHPGWPEGPGYPGRAEGRRCPDALRWAQGQGAVQTWW
jgi:hypothetical protein